MPGRSAPRRRRLAQLSRRTRIGRQPNDQPGDRGEAPHERNGHDGTGGRARRAWNESGRARERDRHDLLLYGTAAALVCNKLFFPEFDPFAGTLGALCRGGVTVSARLGFRLFALIETRHRAIITVTLVAVAAVNESAGKPMRA
jgi:hypothetical protein